MTGEILLDAVGYISDRYVNECSNLRRKKVIWKPLVIAAACICLILTTVWFYSAVKQSKAVPTFPEGDVIWGNGDLGNPVYGDVCAGEILLSQELLEAFACSTNSTDIFAIRVFEVTGAPDEDVYEGFIKRLGVYEEYLEREVIFATQDQIKNISCPEEFGFVFTLAVKT